MRVGETVVDACTAVADANIASANAERRAIVGGCGL